MKEFKKEIQEANEKYESGNAVFYGEKEASEIMKKVKRPLPVRLTEEQHAYLDGKTIGKAEYIRNLLVIDMEKNK